jgi:hypothetical protein
MRRKRSRTRIHNQLKYVCRRLCSKTKQLDMLYNFIIFENATQADVLERCSFLLAQYPALGEVAIKCSVQIFRSNYVRQRFSRIIRYCQTHVGLLVKVHIPYWYQSDPGSMVTDLYFLFPKEEFCRRTFEQTC